MFELDEESKGWTMWMIRSALLTKGQLITLERIQIRQAHLSAIGLSHSDPKKPVKDTFRENQLKIAFKQKRPLLEYAKAQREQYKKRKVNL